jgi:tryptophanyl-tRNA synthetase
MKKIALTGDRPTGPLHIGHFIGSLVSRLDLQHEFQQFIMIADIQALTDNFEHPKNVTDNVWELAKDYLAVGLDPERVTIFIQSQLPQLAELTVYYMNMVNLGRLERNPTVKNEIRQKNFGSEVPVGFFCYPISQAADITAFGAEIVPVGSDQLPMIEQTNEIVRRFNRIYSPCLKEARPLLSKTARLPGLDGKAKMSKSLGNAIYLSDSVEVIKQKVLSMFTDPDHLKVSDPGKIEGNAVFTYLDAFHPNKQEVAELKAHYQKGGLGDMTIKKLLNETLQHILLPIRERREALKIENIREIVMSGTNHAFKAAEETVEKVREAIGLQYFRKG